MVQKRTVRTAKRDAARAYDALMSRLPTTVLPRPMTPECAQARRGAACAHGHAQQRRTAVRVQSDMASTFHHLLMAAMPDTQRVQAATCSR